MPTEEEKQRAREKADQLYQQEQVRKQNMEAMSSRRKKEKPKTAKGLFVYGLLAGLVVGYFSGREHIKYELRSAMVDAVDDIKEGLSGLSALTSPIPATPDSASTAAPAKAPPTAPPARTVATTPKPEPEPEPYKKCLKIGEFGSRQLSVNSAYAELSWRVEVINNCDEGQLALVTFKYLDEQEFLLDDATRTVGVPANDATTVSDKLLMSPPDKAKQIDQYGVSVRSR